MKKIAYLALYIAANGVLGLGQTVANDLNKTAAPLEANIPFVITPSRLPQRIDESPNSITIIDRAMIDASGARTVIELLSLVPGFVVGHKTTALPAVSYQGVTDEFSRRMLLLIDGERIHQYSRGVIEWNILPVKIPDIERIEVIRGPNAAVYGSNAAQAVIDILTRSPAERNGTFAQVTLGDAGTRDVFVRLGRKLENGAYTISLFRDEDAGHSGVQDGRRNIGARVSAELDLNERQTLSVTTGYTRGDYQTPNADSLPPEPDDPDRTFSASELFVNLGLNTVFDATTEWSVEIAFSDFDYADRGYTNSELVSGAALSIDSSLEEQRASVSLSLTKLASEDFRTVSGIGYHFETLRSPGFFSTSETLDNGVFRAFFNGEYRFSDDWVANIGAMLESSNLSAKDWLLLPRASLHYHLSDHQTVRTILSTGSRQPTFHESQARAVVQVENSPLTINRVLASGSDSGGLRPERIQTFELGYQWFERNHLNVDLRAFYQQMDDFIVQFPKANPDALSPSPFTGLAPLVIDFGNEERLDVFGAEAQVDWHYSGTGRVFLGYAYTTLDDQRAKRNSGYATTVPRHALNVLLSDQLPGGWQGSARFSYHSPMNWFYDSSLPAQRRLDARIAKTFQLNGSRVSTALVGTHLLGSVADAVPDITWKTGAYFTLSFDF